MCFTGGREMAKADKRANFRKMVAKEKAAKGEPQVIPELAPMCKRCGRRILDGSTTGLCPICTDQQLFVQVRDYIRENEVNESDVAEHFGIPQSKVRDWIHEGRITYKAGSGMVIMNNYCEVCGRPIEFGSVCMPCKREINNRQKKGVAINPPGGQITGDQRMHFLDNNKKV